MKVQYIASASVIIEHAGIRVLCDPWLTEGIFYGSWYHYPPLKFTPEDLADVDYIYISHIHHDHVDPATMDRLPRDIPILIHDYQEKFLLKFLQSKGYTEITEVSQGMEVALGHDFSVEIIAADNCDPEICGKYFGCNFLTPYRQTIQIDSLAVFRGGGKTLVNVNDCPFEVARTACEGVKHRFDTIDFLLVGYSSGSAYPQCFDNLLEEEKLAAADAVCSQFFERAAGYLKTLQPVSFMPFAGQFVYGGRLTGLNRLKAARELEELPGIFHELLQRHALETRFVLLNGGESFDLATEASSAPFVPPDPVARQQFVDDVLSREGFPYDDDPAVDSSYFDGQLPVALERMQRRADTTYGGYRSDWSVYLDLGYASVHRVPFDGTPVTTVDRGEEREPFLRIQLDPRLMRRILERKAHWNNAELGCHLRFHRAPNRYERAVHMLLCYLHS